MCSGSPWNAFFPPDLFITFSVHPAKKRIFYLRKGLSWPKWSFPVFCVVCVVWSHRAALLACQLGAGINFAFYSFVGAKHIYIFTKKKGCVFDERIFFFDKEGAIAFFLSASVGRLFCSYSEDVAGAITAGMWQVFWW